MRSQLRRGMISSPGRNKYIYSALSHSFLLSAHFISHNLRIHCTTLALTPPWVKMATDTRSPLPDLSCVSLPNHVDP